MTKEETCAREMLSFIKESPTCFHAVENLRKRLQKEGFTELSEKKPYQIKNGGKYFVTRNDSSIAAFVIPKAKADGFYISAAHTDSPCLKIKENPVQVVEGQYGKLNVEIYGGMIQSSWLDRPLSVAGRCVIKNENGFETRLVDLKRAVAIIPNVAIHMNREINKGMEYNAQTDLSPLFSEGSDKEAFAEMICKELKVKKEKLYGYDLFLYPYIDGGFIGAKNEFIYSPRLDDLQSVYGCMEGLIQATPKSKIAMCVAFDNEEVGSMTKQGADSTFLYDTLNRICLALGREKEYYELLANSFLISSDNAHALHPNHPEKADPTNRPTLNGGIVIKYHGSQKYATDAVSTARMKDWCERAKVPFQTYHNRSDIAGGSTLGNISNAHVSIDSVDIGLPQLSMHSACETAGVKDTVYLVKAIREFFGE